MCESLVHHLLDSVQTLTQTFQHRTHRIQVVGVGQLGGDLFGELTIVVLALLGMELVATVMLFNREIRRQGDLFDLCAQNREFLGQTAALERREHQRKELLDLHG